METKILNLVLAVIVAVISSGVSTSSGYRHPASESFKSLKIKLKKKSIQNYWNLKNVIVIMLVNSVSAINIIEIRLNPAHR